MSAPRVTETDHSNVLFLRSNKKDENLEIHRMYRNDCIRSKKSVFLNINLTSTSNSKLVPTY